MRQLAARLRPPTGPQTAPFIVDGLPRSTASPRNGSTNTAGAQEYPHQPVWTGM